MTGFLHILQMLIREQWKLELLGYKVAAFSSDGVIEAIEGKHVNIYFQYHPEAIVVKSYKNLCLSNHKERQVSTLVAINSHKRQIRHPAAC